MRHILFKVSIKGAVEADTKKQSTDGLQLLMMQARKRGLPKRKAEGGTAKDRLYNNIIDSLGQKELDFPHSVADSDGSYFVRVCI